MNRTYDWPGGTEQLLCGGEGLPVQLLILPALFEEANRMRRFTVQLMRRLADAGIGSLLPDLPGTGESLVAIEEVRLDDWGQAIVSLAGAARLTVAIRGGAILEPFAKPDFAWRLSPETGARMLRDLRRTGPTLAGHALSQAFQADLERATVPEQASRTMRIESDPADADVHYSGAPLWRRAEPGEDATLLAAVAADIISWTETCAAS